MTTKEITIAGKTFPVIFNFKAMCNFEEIANESFFSANLEKMSSRIALIVASAMSANKNCPITVDDLVGDKSFNDVKEIVAASNQVILLINEFLEIPKVIADAEAKEAEGQQDDEEGEQIKKA